jgi:o-succinylbenzoate synthase
MIKARTTCKEFTFSRPAITSRGTYLKKKVHYILLYQSDDPYTTGIGECSLFPGLSIDDTKEFPDKLNQIINRINQGEHIADSFLAGLPSLAFALETAGNDLRVMGSKLLYPSNFTEGKDSVRINGLIWMGQKEEMMRQIRQRLEDGFTCLKLKIGALNFEEELDLLRYLRKQYTSEKLEIRVDANGAFKPGKALEYLKYLADYDLHSIEQPIPAGHMESMAKLSASSPIPIALDEELIGIHSIAAKKKLLEIIKPPYLVLKPGLLGGIVPCMEWIELARECKTDWWITSALETNIGLNAIAQWTYTLNNPIAHGLSTGSLYTDIIPSPLYRYNDRLYYDPDRNWDLSDFTNV